MLACYCWFMKKDRRVDDYIGSLPEWQAHICRKVRDVISEADPQMEETIKRGNRPYYVLNGNVCALLATKDHVNVFIYDPIASDPKGLINQGQGNKTARAIQLYEGTNLDEKALLELFREVIANNRAGGWRKLAKTA